MALNAATLTSALTNAAKAATAALSASGRNIQGDVDKFLIPELRGLAQQIILIEQRKHEGLTQNAAQLLMQMQIDQIQRTIIPAMIELTLTELQNIINAALKAIADTVNTALGFAVL